MRRCKITLLIMILSSTVMACGSVAKDTENNSTVQNIEISHADDGVESETEFSDTAERKENAAEMNQIYIKVGENTLMAVLESNKSAEALQELLDGGPLTIPASNYGGFEKVCSLGTELPGNDSQTTTQAGDICLYNGNQIVIFYGSNSWAYTRLGKISDAKESELEKILAGEETEITLSSEAFQ